MRDIPESVMELVILETFTEISTSTKYNPEMLIAKTQFSFQAQAAGKKLTHFNH